MTMFWFVLFILVLLALWLLIRAFYPKKERPMIPCDRCGVDGSMVFRSLEKPGEKICEECAWTEYEHTHTDDTWATGNHT